jgi:hypothetical protein
LNVRPAPGREETTQSGRLFESKKHAPRVFSVHIPHTNHTHATGWSDFDSIIIFVVAHPAHRFANFSFALGWNHHQQRFAVLVGANKESRDLSIPMTDFQPSP